MFSLNMVDYPMSFLSLSTWNLFCWRSRGDHSKMFLLIVFCCGTPPSCLKVMGWWWVVVVAWSNLVSAQGPLVLGLGLRVWGQGLTIREISLSSQASFQSLRWTKLGPIKEQWPSLRMTTWRARLGMPWTGLLHGAAIFSLLMRMYATTLSAFTSLSLF